MHDRWDASKMENGKTRSIDEIKDRYYKVIGVMQKLKSGDDSVYVFDLEHEQKRREQLEKLFNRTKEQVDEELYLIEELKKIEIRKREREKKQLEVNKLLLNLENNANLIQSGHQQVINKARNSNEMRSQSQIASVNGANSAATSNNNANKRIKNRPSGGATTGTVATNRPSSNDPLNRSTTSSNTPSGPMTSAHRSSTGNLNTSSISISQNSGNNSLNNSNDNLHSPSSTTSQANNSLDSKSKKPFVLKVIQNSI